MNINQLVEAICTGAPAYWQRENDGVVNRTLLETFIQGALEVEQSQADKVQLGDTSESNPLRITAQARDRAVTRVARAHFNCAKNQLKQHQQSRLEVVFKKATASELMKIPVRHARYKQVRTNHLPNSANIAREEALASAWLERVRSTVAAPQDALTCALFALYELLNLGYGLYPAASIILHLRRAELRLTTLCTPVHPDEPGPYIHNRIIPSELSGAFQHWADRLDKDPSTRARAHTLTQRQARSPALELPIPLDKRYSSKGLERLIKLLAKNHTQQIKAFQAQDQQGALTIPASLNQLSVFAARLRKRGLTHTNLQHALYTQLESLPLPTDTPNGLGDFLVDTRYHLCPLQRLPYHDDPVGAANPVPALTITSSQDAADAASNSSIDIEAFATVNVTDLQETYSLDELYYADAERYLRQCLREWEKRYGKDNLQMRDKQSFIDQLQHQMLGVQQRFGDDAGLAVALFWLGTRVIGVRQKQVKFATVADFGRRVTGKALLDRNLLVRLSEWEPHHPGCFFKALDTQARGAKTRQQLYQQARMFLKFAREIERLPAELEIPTLNHRYIPFKRRNQFLSEMELVEFCERLELQHREQGVLLALLNAIWFYTGMRPNELLSRTFRDIHLGDGEGYIIIQYGKSDQARRKIEFEEDLPDWVQTRLRSYLEARLATFPKQRRHFDNVALFGPDNNENAYDAQQMTRYLIQLVKEYTGKSIDLHAHRHRFITVQLVCASLPDDFDRSQLKPGVIPQTNPHRQGDISEGYERLKKQAGHLYASTSFENYCHAFGLMLSIQELCRPLLQRIQI